MSAIEPISLVRLRSFLLAQLQELAEANRTHRPTGIVQRLQRLHRQLDEVEAKLRQTEAS